MTTKPASPVYWVYVPGFPDLWGARSFGENMTKRVFFDGVEDAFWAFTEACDVKSSEGVQLGATLPSVFEGHPAVDEIVLVSVNRGCVLNATYQSAAAFAANGPFLADVEWLRDNAPIDRVVEYRRGKLVSTPRDAWRPGRADPPGHIWEALHPRRAGDDADRER